MPREASAFFNATAQELIARLAALERYRRRSLAALAVISVATAFALFTEWTPTYGEVRATSFIMLDARGTERGRLGVLSDGTVGLFLNDVGSETRIGLAIEPDGNTTIALSGATPVHYQDEETVSGGTRSEAAVRLRCNPQGQPSIALRDRTGLRLVSVDLLDDGRPYLYYTDPSGTRVLWELPQRDLHRK